MRTDDVLPNIRDIENLVGYLPILYSNDLNPAEETGRGERDRQGITDTPHPIYTQMVNKLFTEASNDIWMDFAYKPEIQQTLITEEDYIQSASLENIKSLITYCVRGERFCRGHWNQMIQKGYIKNILNRLEIILLEMHRQ